MDWKSGDWVVFELKVGQIKEMLDNDSASFSDGHCETSGRLASRFRPLTLRNKAIVDFFETYYSRLREIDGEAGFNYPDIHRRFAELALQAVDSPDKNEPFELAQQFVWDAKEYKNPIQGVQLFRPSLRRAAR